MDVKDLLENETVKGLLDKFGIPPEKAEGFANQAMNAIKAKFAKDPKQMTSRLSKNDNTEHDEALTKEVEDDFVDRLTKKVGLSDDMAKKAKAAIPGIMSQVTSKLSKDGKNDENGISGMLGNLTEMFDSDNKSKPSNKKGSKSSKKKKSGGIMGMISGFLGK